MFFDFWNSHSFYFEDPSGNIVEFIARHNMKNQTDYPFSMKDLIGVSEVGIVSKNVPNAVKKLNELGIPNFGESSENFAPIGDEHGLFIVVHKGREWFFSNGKEAVSYPVEGWIENIGHITFTSGDDFVIHD